MILLLGSSRDDLLYFESVMRNKEEVHVLGKYNAIKGTIFNQNVMILRDVYTSILSSSLISYMVEKYLIVLVVLVGKCYSYNSNLSCGDIAISKHVIAGDVDQLDNQNVQLCQIPGFPAVFEPANMVIGTINKSLDQFASGRHVECTYVSCDRAFKGEEQIAHLCLNGKVLGKENNIVFDSESAGAAAACYLHNIPFVAVKVVEGQLGKEESIDAYIKILKQYSSVGKSLMSAIGEIGRSDMAQQIARRG